MSDATLSLDTPAKASRAPSAGAMYGASRWWVLAAISFALILFLCPFVLAFTNAIRTPEDYGTYGPLAFPRSFDLTALRDFWNNVDFTRKRVREGAGDRGQQRHHQRRHGGDRRVHQPAQRLCLRHRPGEGQ